MTDLPSQSHASREPRQIAPVTTNAGRVRKAPWGRRVRENFIQESAPNVWGSMFWDVILPGARDVLAMSFHEGIDLFLGGQHRGGYRRNFSSSSSSSPSYGTITTNRYSPDRVLGSRSNERISDADRANHNLGVIEIDSRVEAEEVLRQMNMLIEQFDICTLADFYQMVRISPSPLDYKFGWESIDGATIDHSGGMFFFNLPRPTEFKK